MPYVERIVDRELIAKLEALGAAVIEGPKACGKTVTAQHLAASEVRLDVDTEARQAAALEPAFVLDGPTPRLIDEWQLEPAIWNHVRRAIDDRRKPGQFILTGSAVPADDITRHSGAGRLTRLRMRPMSLYEKGQSTGRISLASTGWQRGGIARGQANPSRARRTDRPGRLAHPARAQQEQGAWLRQRLPGGDSAS